MCVYVCVHARALRNTEWITVQKSKRGSPRNVDILGISRLKWTGMGEFNSDDHYIYYCGQNPSEEMEYPSWSTEESEMQYLDAISKMTE